MDSDKLEGMQQDTKLNVRKVAVMIDSFPDIGQRVELTVKGYVVRHGTERLEAKGTRPFITVDADEVTVLRIVDGPRPAENPRDDEPLDLG